MTVTMRTVGRAAAVSLALALIYSLLHNRGVVSVAVLQAFLFPLVAASLLLVRIAGRRIPLAVVVSGAVLAFVGVGFSVTAPQRADSAVLVAQFSIPEDDLGAVSRVFRERLRDSLIGPQVRIVPYFNRLADSGAAMALLAKSPSKGLVWGTERWISVAFPTHPIRTLADLGSDVGALSDLQIVGSVPVIGLAAEPSFDTFNFLAYLFDGLPLYPFAPLSAPQELSLLSAAEYGAHWNSYAHRAYPWWLIGNHHLIAALRHPHELQRQVRCAFDAYARALSFLRGGDNVELQAALYNNQGVALALQGYMSGEGRRRLKFAQRLWRFGKRSRAERNIYRVPLRAWVAAAHNMQVLQASGLLGERAQKRPAKRRKVRVEGEGETGTATDGTRRRQGRALRR